MIKNSNQLRLVLLAKRIESNFPKVSDRLKRLLRACKDGEPCKCKGTCSCKQDKQETIEGIPMYDSITQETLF